MGGKSKKQTIGYHYKWAMQAVWCRAADALLELRFGNAAAFQGRVTANTQLSINKPNLWGGEKGEGGVVGALDVEFGGPTQVPNSYLAATFGPKQSGNRGKVTTTFRGGRFGAFVPNPKGMSGKWERINVDSLGWYPDKAPIVAGFSELIPPSKSDWKYLVVGLADTVDRSAVDFDDSSWSVGAAPFGDQTSPLDPGPSDYGFNNTPATIVPENDKVWLRTTVRIVGAPVNPFMVRCFVDNSARIYVNGVLAASVGDIVGTFGYNEVEIPASVFVPGDNVVAVEAWDPHSGAGDYFYFDWTLTSAPGSFNAINPAHLLYDALCHPEMAGEPTALVNDASWQAAADQLFSEGFGLCTTYDSDAETPDQFRERICKIIGAEVNQSRIDGLYYLDLVRGGYDVDELPVITDDDIIEFQETPSVVNEAVNCIVIEWFDPVRKEVRTTPPIYAMGRIRDAGEVIAETRVYHEIPNEELALRVAKAGLDAISAPLSRFDLTVRRKHRGLRPGMPFRLQAPSEGVADMVLRAGSVRQGTHLDGRMRLVAVQDVFALPDTVHVQPSPGDWIPPSRVPTAPSAQVALEAPYVELAAALTTADLAALEDDAGYLLTAAVLPTGGLNYAIATAAGVEDFVDRGTADWCPSALVVEAADRPDTAFTLASGSLLDRVVNGSWALWEDEIVRVDAIDAAAGTVTLARGCADTVAVAHSAGARVWFCGDWNGRDLREYVDGDAVHVKLLTRTSSGELAIEDASAIDVAMSQRQFRPYPPAALTLNATSYPYAATINGTVTVAWSHRDRLLQADQLIDGTAASVGPEPGTTYTLEVYNRDDDSLVHSETGIAGDTTTVTAAQRTVRNRLEVFAVRDGAESWQRASAEFDSGFDIIGVLPGGTRQRAYSETLTAPDATAPVAWSISAGALPAGWAINAATGEISGTATAAVGYYTFTVQAVDDAGLTTTREYTIGIGNLVSLLPCDGTDGSTTFTDTTGKVWTVTGNAQVDTGDADFPTGAGQFDGNGDYLTGPTSSDWAFGTGDFTIGCWVKHAAATGGGVNNDRIVLGRFGAPAFVTFLTNDNLRPALWDGSSQRNSTIAVPANTKTWVSWTRKAGVLRIHVGGVLGYSGANTINFTDTAGRYVGGNPSSRYFNGRMEDLIVVKGAALYVDDYTPPVNHF